MKHLLCPTEAPFDLVLVETAILLKTHHSIKYVHFKIRIDRRR